MNDLILKTLLALFNATTSVLLAQYFFSAFSEKHAKYSWWTLGGFVIFFISPIFVSISMLNMGILVGCIFLVSINYKFNFFSKIIFTLVYIALNVLIETILGIILSTMLNVNAEMMHSGLYIIFGSFLSKTVFIIVCFLINGVKNRTLVGNLKSNWIPVFVLPISTFFVTYAFYLSTFHYEDDFLRMLSVISLLVLVLGNLLIIRLINQIYDMTLNASRLETAEELVLQQQKQYNLLMHNNETIIKIRHDYKNFLLGMLSILSLNDLESDSKLKPYLEKELKVIEQSTNKYICGNSIIDSIMNYKIIEAKERGVTINVTFRNAQKILISGVDLAILLGNAIDNAIEATEKLDRTEKSVEVDILCMPEQTLITLVNDVEKDVDVNRMESSKGHMHGYGIMNMKMIANKYNGNITFSCEKKKFMTVIILNVKSQTSLSV